MIKKNFPKQELLDLGLPSECDGGKVLVDKIIYVSRWSVHYKLVFQLPEQPNNEAWQTTYSVGATESQDETPWQYEDEVECFLVHEVEKVVKSWEPIQ